MMRGKIAVLIPSVKRERMRPLTMATPNPLVKVNGTPIIDTMIAGLIWSGEKNIYFTVRYLCKQFGYYSQKRDNISLIKNPEYINDIFSAYAACNVMNSTDCFVCEADIYVSDLTIVNADFPISCYYGEYVVGHSDDWLFDQDQNGKIIRAGKCGDNKYNMCGVCYLKEADTAIIRDATIEAYNYHSRYEQKYWDEIVNQKIKNIEMTVNHVRPDQIVEID